MKLQLDKLLKPKEWIGLACAALIAGGIYMFLIEPSLQLFADHDQAQSGKASAEDELSKLRTTFEQLQQKVVLSQRRLKELGGSPPLVSEKDLQIARLTALANVCHITIDQYSPIDTVDEGDHEAVFLQFVGRGDFQSIQNYLHRIESDIDFVDVTHFAVTSIQKEGPPVCQVAWSARINGMRPELLAPKPAAPSTPPQTRRPLARTEPLQRGEGPPAQEVASGEP